MSVYNSGGNCMKVLFGSNSNSNKYIIDFFSSLDSFDLEFIIPESFDDETLLKYAPETEILVKERITKNFLDHAPKLKHVQVPFTGSERIDFELLSGYPHITVSNTHSNSLTIAEHAVALLLDAAKQIGYRDRFMRDGDWSPRASRTMYSVPLVGQTASIIGYGAIGQKIAKMLKNGFDMKILAIKRNPNDKHHDSICDFMGGMQDIPKVLQESDFVFIALPLTKETRDIISSKEFAVMKQGAIIVNIARGPIINEQALYEFLKANKGYAGIDVWYNYPKGGSANISDSHEKLYQNYPFHELDNIIMSPHSAFKVQDIGSKTSQDIIENLKLLAQGKTPINIISAEFGY